MATYDIAHPEMSEGIEKIGATTPSRSLAAHKAAYLAGESPVAGIDCLPA